MFKHHPKGTHHFEDRGIYMPTFQEITPNFYPRWGSMRPLLWQVAEENRNLRLGPWLKKVSRQINQPPVIL